MKRLAVIGAGWAGLSAAVRATQRGWDVTVYEMGGSPGGRARSLPGSVGDRLGDRLGHRLRDRPGDQATELPPGLALDNGQHILIGAYADTLALMREVGVDPETVLHRSPLDLRTPDGQGLHLPTGHPALALMRGVLSARGWSASDRWGLIRQSLGWAFRGFRCGENITVAELCARLPARVLDDLIEPLCVAALNTPSATASATVFLRVLQDALLGGRGASDLLLPKAPLDALLPQPAWAWLARGGALLRPRTRVERLTPASECGASGWVVDGEAHDAVIVATPALEAARLLEPYAPAWSAAARSLQHEPIVTTVLHHPSARWSRPMMALPANGGGPAQFAFDLGAMDHPARGLSTWVTSAAGPWLARGLDALGDAVLRQALSTSGLHWPSPPTVVRSFAERRATFACTAGLKRPPASPLGPAHPGAEPLVNLRVAGDYVEGPYPSTLEGAVRSGLAAVESLNNG